MSCRESSGLVAGGREAEFAAHRASCADCAALGRRMDDLVSLAAGLATPPLPKALHASLLAVPKQTVSCEGADFLLAQALEGELAPADEQRFQFHLSRCSACPQAAETLFAARGLAAPAPAPWLATRLAAGKPARARRARAGFWGLLWSPKGVIGLAYAAAVAVMLTGFNPADLARKSGMARLEDATGAAVAAARTGAVEKIGAMEEKAYRTVEAWKGRLAGYGRATLSNALALLMRTQPRRPPDRPKSGEGKGVLLTNDGVCLAGKPGPAGSPITAWRT
jgi:anti-sigma factor RsiW